MEQLNIQDLHFQIISRIVCDDGCNTTTVYAKCIENDEIIRVEIHNLRMNDRDYIRKVIEASYETTHPLMEHWVSQGEIL